MRLFLRNWNCCISHLAPARFARKQRPSVSSDSIDFKHDRGVSGGLTLEAVRSPRQAKSDSNQSRGNQCANVNPPFHLSFLITSAALVNLEVYG